MVRKPNIDYMPNRETYKLLSKIYNLSRLWQDLQTTIYLLNILVEILHFAIQFNASNNIKDISKFEQ